MDLNQARFNMVEQQVRPWSVLDATVLETMQSIPRDVFVPEDMKKLSYADIEIPLGNKEHMMFPRVEGRMLQELEIGIDDNCLEVGTGSGYVTACIASMSKHVDSIDINEELLRNAKRKLAALNITNASLTNIDALNYNTDKQYDAIAVTGSLPEYLPVFEKMLKPKGRLFIVVGNKQTMHAMKVVRNKDNSFDRSSLFETELNPLVGTTQGSSFHF